MSGERQGLPSGWREVEFSNLLREPLRNGHSARAAEDGKGIRTLTLSAVTYGDFSEINTKVTSASPEKSAGLWLEPGDVLIERSNTAELVGTARVYRGRRDYAIFPDLMIRARLVPEVSDKFIGYFLASEEARNYFRRSAQGIAGSMPKISQGTIERLRVPLAPEPEQDRIVAEIEKQFTRLDAGVEALKRLQAHLRRYRAALLKAACEGRLVQTEATVARAENRGYESGRELLDRLLRKRKDIHESGGARRRYDEPTRADAALPAIPEGWAWASLDQLASRIRNGISTKPDQETGQAILRISAVRPLKVDIAAVRFLANMGGAEAEYLLDEGDLLFTRYNGTYELVGVCGRVPRLSQPLVHPDKLIRVCVLDATVGRLIEIAANAGVSRAFIASRIRTTAGQAGISGADLKCTPIPVPPVEEQRRIILEVDTRLSQVDALEQVVRSSLMRAGSLRTTILRAAFRGELVPQGPNDEPAPGAHPLSPTRPQSPPQPTIRRKRVPA